MKRLYTLLLLGLGLMSFPVLTAAQQGAQVGELATTLVTQMKTILQADNVLGQPLDLAGNKVIPIVSIGFGFASGAGRGEVAQEQGGSGAGGGGGGLITPQALLVISQDGEIKVLEAHKGAVSEIVRGLTPVLLEALHLRRGEAVQDTGKPPASAEKP